MSSHSPWLRLRVPLGFLFAAWYVFVAKPSSPVLLIVTGVLAAVGCALRAWAAGHLLKGKRVAVGGPYAYIRNPLYMGSFLIGVAFCLALWRQPLPVSSVILWLTFVIGFGVVYRAKSLAEEKELAVNLGAPYIEYAAKVPAFLPVRGRVQGLGVQRFSAELFRRNREYQCVVGSAALFLYLVARYWHGF